MIIFIGYESNYNPLAGNRQNKNRQSLISLGIAKVSSRQRFRLYGMTCEISVVNKMAAGKISLLFLSFSSSTTGPMQERMVKTLLLHFSYVLMSLKFSNLLISWKKCACHHTYEIGFKRKGGIFNGRHEFNFPA